MRTNKVDLAAVLARLEALEVENAALKAKPASEVKLTKADKYPGAFMLGMPGKKPKFLYGEEAEWLAANIEKVRSVLA